MVPLPIFRLVMLLGDARSMAASLHVLRLAYGSCATCELATDASPLWHTPTLLRKFARLRSDYTGNDAFDSRVACAKATFSAGARSGVRNHDSGKARWQRRSNPFRTNFFDGIGELVYYDRQGSAVPCLRRKPVLLSK
jgi:hypothetical protein